MRGHYYPSAFSLQPEHLINFNIRGKPQECQLQWAQLREKWSRRQPLEGKKKSAFPSPEKAVGRSAPDPKGYSG
jgi:hypothetical protein